MNERLEGKRRLSWEDVRAMDAQALNANQVGGLLGIDPNTIRQQAREDPALLGYPVSVAGCRVHIPRIPFLRFWGFDV